MRMQIEPEEEGGYHVLLISINEAMALKEKSHHLHPTPAGLWKSIAHPYLQSVASRLLSSHSCWCCLGTFRGSSLTLCPLSAYFFDPENLLDLTHTIRPIPSDFLSKLWKNFASLSKLFFWSYTLTVAMEKLTEPVSIKQTQSLPGTGITQCIFSPRVFWHLIWRGRQHGKNLGLAIRRVTTLAVKPQAGFFISLNPTLLNL